MTSAASLPAAASVLMRVTSCPAGRAHHLDPHEREALVEGFDDLLLHLGEVRGVVDDLAFLLRGLDEFRRAEGVLAGGPRRQGKGRNGSAPASLKGAPTCQR